MVSRRDVVRLALALPFLGFGGAAAAQEQARVYIFGFVRNPGAYTYKPEMTVGDALDLAGGIPPNRKASAIEIIRLVNGGKETHSVSFNDAVLAGDSIVVK